MQDEKMKALRKLQTDSKNFLLTLLSISLILVIVLILYWQDLTILANEALQNEATNHILLVPILALLLVYRRKDLAQASIAIERFKRKTQVISFTEIIGIALCLSALLLYWYGIFTFYPIEYHVVSLIIFLIGITLALFNAKALIALIFPILFLIFLMPPPTTLTLTIGGILGNFNAQTSYQVLKTLGMPVTLSSEFGPPTILLNIPTQQPLSFAVDIACSGIYSLVAFAMFAAFLFYVTRGSITRRLILIPLGFLMFPILNVLRISLIVIIALEFGEPIAMTVFHTFSGILLISLGMLILLLIAQKPLHLKIYETQNKIASCSECNDTSRNNETFCTSCGKFLRNHQTKPSTRFWTKITALLLISCVVALSMQAPVFAFAQGLTLTNADPEASTSIFPNATGYQLTFLYRDQNFEKVAHQDANLNYAYFPQNFSNPTVYLIVAVAGSITNLHSWEVCLYSYQTAQGYWPTADVLESRDIQIMDNPPITGQFFVFTYPSNYPGYANFTQVTLYWYQIALFKTGLTIVSRYTRINLVILTRDKNDYPILEQSLLKMGQSIAAYWEPIKAQSIVSLGVPAIQIMLGSSIILAIALLTTEHTTEWRRKATNLRLFERYGSPEEKGLYQTIKDLRRKTKEITTKNIESVIRDKPANSVKPYDLQDTLRNLQENGIIRLDLINVLDQPRLVWKP